MDYRTAKKVHSSKDYNAFNIDPSFLFINQFMKKGRTFSKDLQKSFLQYLDCKPHHRTVNKRCEDVYKWVQKNDLLDKVIEYIHLNRDKSIWYTDPKEIQEQLKELKTLPLFSKSFNPTNSINRAIFDKVQNAHSVEELNTVVAEVAKIAADTMYKMYFETQTTRIIEDIFNSHKKVTPTLIDEKGVDFFIDRVPLDLKITHIPSGFSTNFDKTDLITNLYEKQGAVRFCADNRLFLILHNKKKPKESYKLRVTHFEEIKKRINTYLDNFKLSDLQDITFTFDKKKYNVKSDIISVII